MVESHGGAWRPPPIVGKVFNYEEMCRQSFCCRFNNGAACSSVEASHHHGESPYLCLLCMGHADDHRALWQLQQTSLQGREWQDAVRPRRDVDGPHHLFLNNISYTCIFIYYKWRFDGRHRWPMPRIAKSMRSPTSPRKFFFVRSANLFSSFNQFILQLFLNI